MLILDRVMVLTCSRRPVYTIKHEMKIFAVWCRDSNKILVLMMGQGTNYSGRVNNRLTWGQCTFRSYKSSRSCPQPGTPPNVDLCRVQEQMKSVTCAKLSYVGVIRFVFLVLHLVLIRFTS